jgi:hypothetical protein
MDKFPLLWRQDLLREPHGSYNHTPVRTRGNGFHGVLCGLQTPARIEPAELLRPD